MENRVAGSRIQKNLLLVPRKDKLFNLECKPAENADMVGQMNAQLTPVNADIWHARCGHLHQGMLKTMKNCVEGLIVKNISKNGDENDICEGCAYGKSSVKAFLKSDYGVIKTQSMLEVVHSDVVGPIHTISQGGARYMVAFIDDYSRYVSVYVMKRKSQLVE